MTIGDVLNGPAFLLLGLAGGLILLGAVILVEAVVLLLLQWRPVSRTLRDSLVMNIASALVGLVATLVIGGLLISPGVAPRSSALVTLFVVSWLVSIAVEAGILFLLEHKTARRTWTAAFATNTASYALLFVGALLSGVQFFL